MAGKHIIIGHVINATGITDPEITSTVNTQPCTKRPVLNYTRPD
jgi:uncharacterized protein (DUF2461 family)